LSFDPAFCASPGRQSQEKKRLGEVPTERGKICASDLAKALQLQKERSGYLGELLLQAGLVSREDLVATLDRARQAAKDTVEKAEASNATRHRPPDTVREKGMAR
jgi:hypothetical protein